MATPASTLSLAAVIDVILNYALQWCRQDGSAHALALEQDAAQK